jgi:hypothetical protein
MKNKKEKVMQNGRVINPLTGCREGSKMDIMGTVMLNTSDPVKLLKALEMAVAKHWDKKGREPKPNEIHRKAMGWVDYLHQQKPKEFKSVPEAIVLSQALRAATKPAKVTKVATKKPAVKKSVKKTAKQAPAVETNTQSPAAGDSL